MEDQKELWKYGMIDFLDEIGMGTMDDSFMRI